MAGLDTVADRVVVVTGGASGIGLGIAEQFVDHGAHVVLADVDDEGASAAAAGIGAIGIRVDVRDPGSLQELAEAVLERHGRVDVVCNNAGVGPRARIADMTPGDWSWVLDVNLLGVVHGSRVFLPHLAANERGGWIVNTSSMAPFMAAVGYAAYAASKAAVTAFSDVLRAELVDEGADVGVTVLHPSAVRTNIAHSLRSRPAELAVGSGLADFDLARKLPKTARWLEPPDVGRLVVGAVLDGDPHVLTHPESAADVERWAEGVNRAVRPTEASS